MASFVRLLQKKQLNTIIVLKNDTKANWDAVKDTVTLRVGEIGDNLCKCTRRAVREDLNISELAISQLINMKSKITDLYSNISEIFMSKNVDTLPVANEIEETIDNLRKQMVDDHFDRLNRGECSPNSSGVFVNLVNNLERAADHMMYIGENVNEALKQSKK